MLVLSFHHLVHYITIDRVLTSILKSKLCSLACQHFALIFIRKQNSILFRLSIFLSNKHNPLSDQNNSMTFNIK